MALTKISSNLVADDAIVTGKIADGGVGTADLAANAVTSAKIAQNSILTKHIDDGQVDTAQIAADAITGAKIADDAISEEHLDVTVISSLTEVTAVDGDYVLIGDTSDSNNLKKVLVSSIRESADLLKTEATGDGSTVAYTLNEAPSSENATMVFFDGVYQHKSTYAVSGSTLTFDTAPLASTDIEIMASTTAALNVPADDSVQTAKIAANAVTSAKIASNSILTRHIDDDQITGDQLATNIAISGNLITGGTIAPGGVLTANAGVVVDNITIDGTEIDLSSGDLTLDVAGRIDLSADDNGEVRLYDGSSMYGQFKDDDDRFKIQSLISNKDMMLVGNDNGSEVTALLLDMSEAGAAHFNSSINVKDTIWLNNTGNTKTIGYMYDDSDNFVIRSYDTNADIIFKGNDGGSIITAMTIDMSAAGSVGIGETSPAAPLHVEHSSSTAYNGATEVTESTIISNKHGTDNSGVNNYASLGFHVADGATSQGFINYVRTGNNVGKFTFSERTASDAWYERMSIDGGVVTMPQQARMVRNLASGQTISTSSTTAINWASNESTVGINYTDSGGSAGEFSIVTAGVYLINAYARFQSAATGHNAFLSLHHKASGGSFAEKAYDYVQSCRGYHQMNINRAYNCAAGDTMKVVVWHDKGSNLDLTGNGSSCAISVTKVT